MTIESSGKRLKAMALLSPLLLTAMPAFAQTAPNGGDSTLATAELAQDPTRRESGRTAEVANVEIGQRQTREEAATGIEAIRRIPSRIQNRIQNRIRNRIDRFYDPRANAASPFEVASDQARTAGRRPPR